VIDALVAALAPLGLNLVGACALDAYDASLPPDRSLRALAPAARTAIVIGHGGGAFWHAYRRFAAAHPGQEKRADPLDRWTAAAVERALRPLLGDARLLHPFGVAPVSFTRLAACAGLGVPGRVGVLLHPTFGPWIAFRAAALVRQVVALPRPADQFDPCPACATPACIAACPAGAVGDAGWDLARCAGERGRPADPCAAGCHARIACVVGPEHRYPADALIHHQVHARAPLLAVASAASVAARDRVGARGLARRDPEE
jgi:epoxyqueuosine reductase